MPDYQLEDSGHVYLTGIGYIGYVERAVWARKERWYAFRTGHTQPLSRIGHNNIHETARAAAEALVEEVTR